MNNNIFYECGNHREDSSRPSHRETTALSDHSRFGHVRVHLVDVVGCGHDGTLRHDLSDAPNVSDVRTSHIHEAS